MTDAELDQVRHNGALLHHVVSRQVKLKKSGRAWKGLCPFHTEKTPSFTVFEDGHYHCFGCNAHGTSFDYIMQTEHIEFREAVERIEAETGTAAPAPKPNGAGAVLGNGEDHAETWQSIVPPPADAPKPDDRQLSCDMLHEYRGADDRLLCYVRRHEAKGDKRKQFLPLTYGVLDGKRGWHTRAPNALRPLYGLNRLLHAAPDAIVILCEGEKCADAVQRMFPDHVAMSWMGGAKAVASADLSPLHGHQVITWGDADAIGLAAMTDVAKRLQIAGTVDTEGLPDGFDGADLEQEGCEDPDAWLDARLREPNGAANGADADELARWPEPVDILADSNTGAPILTAEHVPPALWPFIKDTAERMGVATSSVALAAIVSCASAISEDWRVQPKRHDYLWTEQARLWGAIVGPPSILKSPVIKAATDPVAKLDRDARKIWADETAAYKVALNAWKDIKNNPEPEPQPPRKARYLVESTTIEALQEVLRDDIAGTMTAPLGKVLVRRDELSGFVADMDKYSAGSEGGGSEASAWLQSYNGGDYAVDRIQRGSFTASSWSTCVLGGIQPEPIQRIATHAAHDGLLQRFMFDVPVVQTGGLDRAPDYPAIVAYRDLFPALVALRPARTGDVNHPHTTVLLHADAHASREDIDRLAFTMAHMPNASKQMQAALGKWAGTFARLCLTFHLIEIAAAHSRQERGPPTDAISPDTARRVQAFMRGVLAPNLLRADALMFSSRQTEHAAWIAGYILAGKMTQIAARNVQQHYKALKPPEQRPALDNTMDSLCRLGWLEPIEPNTPGRQPTNWTVNPRVHSRFAEQAEAERKRRDSIREAIAQRADYRRSM